MKIILSFIILFMAAAGFLFGQIKSEQKYIIVEARRRITGSDGSVTYRAYEPFKTRSVELLPGYSSVTEPESLSKYGGLLSHKTKPTGFFRVEKTGNRWWCVDPEGYLYFNIALNSISMGGSDRNKNALIEKFGTPDNWISQTIKMLQANGFTCAGSWSDYKAIAEANKKRCHPPR